MKRVLSIVMAIVALVGTAQESQSIKLQFDQSKISPQFTMPELPGTVMPATNIKPTFNINLPTAADLKLDYRSSLSDSLAIYQQQWRTARPALPRFSYDTSPYSRDWSSGGVITRLGGGYLTGASSHTTYPGMGNMASASVAFTMPMGDRFQFTAGLTGSKYHFDRSAWNDYGVFGNASFWLNDRLSLNAFGQYYVNQQFHSVAAMPFLGSSSYGGTLGWKASDSFSLDVGARRIYDPYTGRWRTLPVVQPTFNLLGAPISIDAGPWIYQLLDGLLNGGKNSKDWGDPKYRPVTVPDAVRNQPGFNPNSPVPIPDAFRH
ncbi:MAG: hypothetical protein IJG42_06445 [Muribaculaceae bacterium]|nr:hypothetical protein [Muribaculaceae bacterium]